MFVRRLVVFIRHLEDHGDRRDQMKSSLEIARAAESAPIEQIAARRKWLPVRGAHVR